MRQDKILLAHGGGGELTARLIDEHIVKKLQNDKLSPLMDSAVLEPMSGSVCMTTDSFVVQPLDFPGGDIGRLAVCGTVNDLVMMGAQPKGLSLAFIIEEGLEIAKLDQIVDSIAQTAKEAGVSIVTGDTKVVERGRGDGLLINTAGIGEQRKGLKLGYDEIVEGDLILINGPIAEHGLAVMSAREGLAFATELKSDVAPLGSLVSTLLDSGACVKFMRDPTRSGIAGVANDLAQGTSLSIDLDESAIPLTGVVRHTAEMLGLDPLTVANEGKVVAVVAAKDKDKALAAMQSHPLGKETAVIGVFTKAKPPLVELVTRIGGRRVVQRPYGEELPRIC